jgi:transposase-like protein
MTKKRQRRSTEFKFRVALEALKEQKTLSQMTTEYEVHPTQITQWKKLLLDAGSELLGQQRARDQQAHTAREAERFEQIGRLQMELEWLKKTSPVACDIPPSEQRSRLPLGACASTIGCGIPKTRPPNVLVCGRPPSDQNP